MNFAKPKSDSYCKKAVGSTSNDPVFNIPIVEESSFESLNEMNKGKWAHFNESLSYNDFCQRIWEDDSADLSFLKRRQASLLLINSMYKRAIQ